MRTLSERLVILCSQALEFASLDRIKLTHIRGNPLIRKDMARHVDISRSGGLETLNGLSCRPTREKPREVACKWGRS
jgi:hypothetical protein